jgi:anaerobic carbon-monoxide dehydrogenase iron sulfur subunit
MKEVVVHPEKCVGCMQCMAACAVAHSKTKQLYTALGETPRPRSRIHVGVGLYQEGFPNRCRHCDPAPCMLACLAGAIFRDDDGSTVLINPDRCIDCASCAMACPYGVIRFHEDPHAPPGKTIAAKCDNCDERRSRGLIPACVEACKSKALTYEELSESMKKKTDAVARSVSAGAEAVSGSPGWELLKTVKKAQLSI